MKIRHVACDGYEGVAERIRLDLSDGLNVVDAQRPQLARHLADLVGHVLYGARLWRRDETLHDLPGHVDVESSGGRFRLERHAERVHRGNFTEPRLTVASLDGHAAQSETARELLGGLTPEIAARLLVLRTSDQAQLDWLLSESLATELHRLENIPSRQRVDSRVTADFSEQFALRDRLSHQIERLLAEKRRSSEALEAALNELSLETDAAQRRLADTRRELDSVLARLAELETQLRYHEMSEVVGRTADEAYHDQQQPLLADLDEEIARWRKSLGELEAREAQVRQQLSQRHPDDSSPLLPLADQRAAMAIAERLVADLDSEVARYARPSDSTDCLCRHTHARLHPLIDTLGQQIGKLNSLVEQYEAAVAGEQLKLEVVHLERAQQELRATIDHLLDRRESRLRISRARRPADGIDRGELPRDWQQLRSDLETRRSELTDTTGRLENQLQELAARRDRLHRERAELMNDSTLVALWQQLDDVTRQLDQPVRSSSNTTYSVAPWRASDILAKLTDGRLREVRLIDGGRRATIVEQHGKVLGQDQLSEVDRRLLCMSLQLAAIAGAAQWGLRLPLLVANPFVELPAAQSAILALVLHDLARSGHQVLIATSSTEVVDRLRAVGQEILSLEVADEPSVASRLRTFVPDEKTLRVEAVDAANHNDCALDLSDPIERFAVFGEDTHELFSAIGIRKVRDLLQADAESVSRDLDRTGISTAIVDLWQTHVAMLVYVPHVSLLDAQLLTSADVRSLEQLATADADELHQAIQHYLDSPRGVRYRSGRAEFSRHRVGRWITAARGSRSRWSSTPYAYQRRDRSSNGRSDPPGKGQRSSAKAKRTKRERPLRFRLSRTSPVVDAPSIGPKTAKRLAKVGIETVADLLVADAAVIAEQLAVRHITAEKLVEWQHQAQLMCRVPELLVRDAQILVGCGFTTPEGIASAEASDLLEFAKSFTSTPEGTRALRGGDEPDLDRVKKWIYWAEHRRAMEAA